MRNILFRAKRAKHRKGEWVFGNLSVDDSFAQIGKFARIGCAVDEQTIGQYTGLDDRYGTPIYEGDIVKFLGNIGRNRFFIVEYMRGAFILRNVWGIKYLHDVNTKLLMIFGNIHDNHYLALETLTGRKEEIS